MATKTTTKRKTKTTFQKTRTFWLNTKIGDKFKVVRNTNDHNYPEDTLLTVNKNITERDKIVSNIAIEFPMGNNLDIKDVEFLSPEEVKDMSKIIYKPLIVSTNISNNIMYVNLNHYSFSIFINTGNCGLVSLTTSSSFVNCINVLGSDIIKQVIKKIIPNKKIMFDLKKESETIWEHNKKVLESIGKIHDILEYTGNHGEYKMIMGVLET